MAYRFYQIFLLGVLFVSSVLALGPTTVPSNPLSLKCGEMRCSISNQFCKDCCIGEGYTNGFCKKRKIYYFCYCQ
ncbi:hypothetical protein AAZX31_18G157500 [Glycine max]|nr:hypothetical protein GLYMA_18G173350v4 [Glycine max]KAH1154892.1 hypothetical protein GYH30_050262 [Glycine max]